MDIERLSKAQIVLLTLLISFVTSIATGIVTVSLMDQAPPAISQTVNRVIERTVQTVVPATQTSAAIVTQEKTVIVKESDLISTAINKATPSLTRLYSSGTESPEFIGFGIVLNDSGTIAADIDALGENADALVQRSDGGRVRAFVTSRDTKSGIAYLSAATSTVEGKATGAWTPITLSAERPALGSTVVMLGGKTVLRIATGIVTALTPATETAPLIIETDLSSDVIAGAPIITTDGTLVGVSTGVVRTSSSSGFMPASVLVKPPAEKPK